MKAFDKRKVPGLEDCSSDSEDEDEIPLKRLCNNDDIEIELEVQDNEFLKEEPLIELNDKPKKINSVWGHVVQENLLDESFNKVGVNKLNVERNVESYSIDKKPINMRKRIRSSNGHNECESRTKDVEEKIERRNSKEKHKCKDIKSRIGSKDIKDRIEMKNNSANTENSNLKDRIEIKDVKDNIYTTNKDRSHIPINPEVDTKQHIVFEIARLLQEPKIELIEKCMNVLGKEKCLEFFYMTEDIEENGGLMVVNGSRRRTAGGVFLTLIKESKKVDDESKRLIFPYDFSYRARISGPRQPNRLYGPIKPRNGNRMDCKAIMVTRAPDPVLCSNLIDLTPDTGKTDNEEELEEGEII